MLARQTDAAQSELPAEPYYARRGGETSGGGKIRKAAVNGSHNVRSRGVNWTYFRNLPLGTSVARRFNRKGTFRYFCTIHGRIANGVCTGMCGRIVVG